MHNILSFYSTPRRLSDYNNILFKLIKKGNLWESLARDVQEHFPNWPCQQNNAQQGGGEVGNFKMMKQKKNPTSHNKGVEVIANDGVSEKEIGTTQTEGTVWRRDLNGGLSRLCTLACMNEIPDEVFVRLVSCLVSPGEWAGAKGPPTMATTQAR